MKVKALKGFKDILPGEVELWQHVEDVTRSIFNRHNFSEIRMPILEQTDLFKRSIGEDTDIVEKEMYTFVDKGVTMRPEATASLIRAYIEHSLHVVKPVQRLFTIGPMFRHERPQKGRLRQFHQMDIEVLGSQSPMVDAELMAMAAMVFKELDINVRLEINSLGCPECRPAYRKRLIEFIEGCFDELCDNCKRRSKTNPLRVLDCKNKTCREKVEDAPSILEHLCGDCSDHFATVRSTLESLEVDFNLNKFMVRGLDYYCRTTFEFITDDLGAQSAVCAGGRYDGLVEKLGGAKGTPGIGFAMGMERLVLLIQQQEKEIAADELDLFIVGLGDKPVQLASKLSQQLRLAGVGVALDYEGRSLKAQMKLANKLGAVHTLIIGENELEAGKAPMKNMKTQEQVDVALFSDDVQVILDTVLQNS